MVVPYFDQMDITQDILGVVGEYPWNTLITID